jgi:polar amino acid transport system substrate-binding protein
MLSRIIGLLAATLALIGAPGCASLSGDPAPVLSRILDTGVLRVGMSGDQAPLNATSRAGEMFGLEVDLAKVLAGSMGVEVELVAMPFPELLGALEAGDVDMVMSGMTITPQRNAKFAFVGPYFVSGKSILTRSAALAAASQATDIDRPSVRLAALDGSTSQRFVEVFTPKATLVATASYDEAVTMVREGQVDAVVADFPICVLSAMRYPGEGLVTLTSPLTIEPIGIALPASDALFVNLVTNYLNAVQATGALDQLRARWFENGDWVSRLP